MQLATKTSVPEKSELVFREARAEDSQNIVACYESVFGKDGIRAPGHAPYPAPEVFFEQGVKQIISDPLRQFMVVETAGEIAGGMIISHNSKFHREFGCVAVSKRFQGQGISSFMLKQAKELERQQTLSINITEIVTHSMLSQSAHANAGYNQITGFGFCQYPRVFFKDHPESCLWVTSFEGNIIEALRRSRPKWHAAQKSHTTGYEDHFGSFEERLLTNLEQCRAVFVPQHYLKIVSRIASQFEETFSFRIHGENDDLSETTNGITDWQLDPCDDYPYAYLNLPSRTIGEEELLQKIQSLPAGKRYIQARVSTSSAVAIRNIELLRTHGFVFLGWVPLFRYAGDKAPVFDDVLLMQRLHPDLVATNALPGETNAVVKLHGYPLNLTGDLIATIRMDLRGSKKRWDE